MLLIGTNDLELGGTPDDAGANPQAHPNADGYTKWAAALRPLLTRIARSQNSTRP